MSTDKSLEETGKSAATAIVDMVMALECDYDRLEELKADAESHGEGWADCYRDEANELAELIAAAGECTSREEAETRIQEDALSVTSMKARGYTSRSNPKCTSKKLRRLANMPGIHSPAPWTTDTDARSPARILSGTDCVAMVYLTDPATKRRDEKHAANVSLIKAAPDLAIALALIVEMFDEWADRQQYADEYIDMARAALVKADWRS